MVKKLVLIAGTLATLGLAACSSAPVVDNTPITPDSLRNPPGGAIVQYTNPFSAAPEWQIVMADSNTCQRFIARFNSKPDVVKYAVDCWDKADNASASLKTQVELEDKIAGKLVLETIAATAKDDACSAAVATLKDVGVSIEGKCPAPPAAPAPAAK